MSKVKHTIFASRLNRALDKLGMDKKPSHRAKALGGVMGVSYQAAGKWLDGRSLPDTEKLDALARFVNVSIDYLFGRDWMQMATNFPDGCHVTKSPGNCFSGEVSASDTLVIAPIVSDRYNDGSLFVIETPRDVLIRRLNFDGLDRLTATFEDDTGIETKVVEGAENVANYLKAVTGEVVAVIRSM